MNEDHLGSFREIDMLLQRLAADAFELMALAAILCSIAVLAHP